MSAHGMVAEFDHRADGYETGRLGDWHRHVARRVADVATARVPVPLRVLDVGCGTGLALRELSFRLTDAVELVGIDPSPRMLAVAERHHTLHCRYERATAEELPFDEDTFDLIVACLSFDHWADQRRGLAEVARVLRPAGSFVLADVCAPWLPAHRRARRPTQVRRYASAAGLRVAGRERVARVAGLPLVQASILTP